MYNDINYINPAPLINVNPYLLPNTSDVEFNAAKGINNAFLKKENDLTRFMDFSGNLAMSIGSQLVGKGIAKNAAKLNSKLESGAITQSQFNNKMNLLKGANTAMGLFGSMSQYNSSPYGSLGNSLGSTIGSLFAMGGSNPMNIPYGSAEGGELLEDINGNYQELEGNSHEQGGIPINPQELSNIYSNRVKIDGLSIADREKKRIKKNASLEDLINFNPFDKTLIKTWERTKSNNEKMKKKELELQQYINNLLS